MGPGTRRPSCRDRRRPGWREGRGSSPPRPRGWRAASPDRPPDRVRIRARELAELAELQVGAHRLTRCHRGANTRSDLPSVGSCAATSRHCVVWNPPPPARRSRPPRVSTSGRLRRNPRHRSWPTPPLSWPSVAWPRRRATSWRRYPLGERLQRSTRRCVAWRRSTGTEPSPHATSASARGLPRADALVRLVFSDPLAQSWTTVEIGMTITGFHSPRSSVTEADPLMSSRIVERCSVLTTLAVAGSVTPPRPPDPRQVTNLGS